jgi:hypothetical protein
MPLTLTDLSALAEHPLRLLRQGGEFGMRLAKRAIPTILLFTVVNLVAIVAASVQLIGQFRENIKHFSLVLLVAAIVMVIVFRTIYVFFRAQIFLELYKLSSDNLNEFSQSVATKLKQAAPTAAVDTVVNVTSMVGDAYAMIPAPLRKLVVFVLSQVAITRIIMASRQQIVDSKGVDATNNTYRLIDTHVRAYIHEQLGMLKTWLLLAANIIVQGLIIFWWM